ELRHIEDPHRCAAFVGFERERQSFHRSDHRCHELEDRTITFEAPVTDLVGYAVPILELAHDPVLVFLAHDRRIGALAPRLRLAGFDGSDPTAADGGPIRKIEILRRRNPAGCGQESEQDRKMRYTSNVIHFRAPSSPSCGTSTL